MKFKKQYYLWLLLAALGFAIATAVFLFVWKENSSLIGKDFGQPISEFGEFSDKIHAQFIPTEKFDALSEKRVVCLFSLKCVYCRKSVQLISELADKYQFSESVLVFFTGREVNVNWFFNTTNSQHFEYKMMDKELLSKITDGQVPQILLMNKGVVENVLTFEDINDETLKAFFEN